MILLQVHTYSTPVPERFFPLACCRRPRCVSDVHIIYIYIYVALLCLGLALVLFVDCRGYVRRGVLRLAAVGGVSEDRLCGIPRDQAFGHLRERDRQGVVGGQ